MTPSIISNIHHSPLRKSTSQPCDELHPVPAEILKISHAVWETHIGSVLVLTEDYQLLYATDNLQGRLQALSTGAEDSPLITPEIDLICQILRQSRDRFPHQNWSIEFDILTKDAIALRIRSRWLKLEGIARPCMLMIIEDHQQLIQDMVLDEAHDLGLTSREQEVWLLHRNGYTYRQIAEKLYITINTVKKHMRSIHAKQKSQFE